MTSISTQKITVANWRPFEKNTLRGFISLTTPAGLVINGVTLHEKGDSRWVSMPAKQYEKDGETGWAPVVEFATKDARERFQAAALAAVDEYLREVQ